jgi:hypothetical protein
MSRFPTEPVSPREFIEDVIPSLFAEWVLDEEFERLDFKLGVSLCGREGGDWTLHFIEGELGIAEGLAEDCGLTLLQSVADWRGALWEGRPGVVADSVRILTEQGPPGLATRAGRGAPSNREAFRELETLTGRIDAIVAGERAPDWRVGVHVGPGPIPGEPRATIRVGADQAESIRRGELHPVEALITGQLRLEGDLGLILQLQAIAMAASMPPSGQT